MLAKQAWHILKNPNTPSASVLKVVHFHHQIFLEATVGFHLPQIWRALIERRDVMIQGLIRRIGSDTNTHASNQGWIPRDCMLRPL
jgi:hypothetical protein